MLSIRAHSLQGGSHGFNDYCAHSGAMTFTPFVILTAIGMNGRGNPR
jgi:hypothetical protein